MFLSSTEGLGSYRSGFADDPGIHFLSSEERAPKVRLLSKVWDDVVSRRYLEVGEMVVCRN